MEPNFVMRGRRVAAPVANTPMKISRPDQMTISMFL